MASNILTALQAAGAAYAWNMQTGAALIAGAALTLVGAPTVNAGFLNGSGIGGAVQFNGTTQYATSGGAGDAGQFCIDRLSDDGFIIGFWFTATARGFPTGDVQCLATCFNSNSTGWSIGLGASGFDNFSGNTPSIVVTHYGNTGNDVFYFALTGDGATYGRLTDGKRHKIAVFMVKGVCILFVDGIAITAGSTSINGAANTWTYTNAVLTIGAKKIGATINRYAPFSIQGVYLMRGRIAPQGLHTLMESAYLSPGRLVDALELDVGSSTMLRYDVPTGTEVPAGVGDQIRRITSADGKAVGVSPVEVGTISGITAGNPTVITCSAAHGLIAPASGRPDQRVVIYGSSTAAINGSHKATVTGATTFTIPINTAGVALTGNEKWAVNHGPILGVNAKGKMYLRFPNRWQRRGWNEPHGAHWYYMDVTLTHPTAEFQMGRMGIYCVGGLLSCVMSGSSYQNVAIFQTAANVNRFGVVADNAGGRASFKAGATILTPTSAHIKSILSTPTVSCFGITSGSLGDDLAANAATGVSYCDGVQSALSGGIANGTIEYLTATVIRLGADTIADPLGADMRLYTLRAVPRPVMECESRRSEHFDRQRLGLPMRPRLLVRVTDNSTGSGEQDELGDGWQGDLTGIDDCAMINTSIANTTWLNITDTYDFTLPCFHMPKVPSINIFGHGINDGNTGVTYTQMATAALAIVKNVEGNSGAPSVNIYGLTAATPGVAPNTRFNTWAQSSASPFDFTFQFAGASLAAGTSDDPSQIHPNWAGHAANGATVSALIQTVASGLGLAASTGGAGSGYSRGIGSR